MFSSPLDKSIGEDPPRKLTDTPSSSSIDTSSITHEILPKSSHFPATHPSDQSQSPWLHSSEGGRLDLDSIAMRRNKMFMILHSLSNGPSTLLTLCLGKVAWPCQEWLPRLAILFVTQSTRLGLLSGINLV